MVCIAAFIILALIGVFVAIISIFKPAVGKAYWKMFKKAWGCLWKKVRLQKCETGFKDDVKNTILSRVIVSHPKWVKPLSIIIEVVSVVIVVVVVWALITAVKSLLALWALGSCNVSKPEACSMGAEVCSINASEPKNPIEATGRWFEEWGEIFEAIPDKFRSYNAADYDFSYVELTSDTSNKAVAADIFDPGCVVCMVSYRNQKEAGFFEQYDVRLVPFAIQDAEDNYKFKNSEIIVRYILAADALQPGTGAKIIDKIFTGKNSEGISYQNKFNDDYSYEEAVSKLETWIRDFGFSEDDAKKAGELALSDEITAKMTKNREIVEKELRVKGIPTTIYDGRKHTGLWSS